MLLGRCQCYVPACSLLRLNNKVHERYNLPLGGHKTTELHLHTNNWMSMMTLLFIDMICITMKARVHVSNYYLGQ